MTVKEVLIADWTVDEIEITVRDTATTQFLTEYHIGENLKVPYRLEYIRETKAGTLYNRAGMKHLYMNRIIQHRHLPLSEKRNGYEACVGVLTENIPRELLELEIEHMIPYGLGKSDDMHGYRFDCYVGMWFGVPGENENAGEED